MNRNLLEKTAGPMGTSPIPDRNSRRSLGVDCRVETSPGEVTLQDVPGCVKIIWPFAPWPASYDRVSQGMNPLKRAIHPQMGKR